MLKTGSAYFGLIRIAFGFVWAADAYLKWLPGVRDNIIGVLTQAQDGQPAWEQAWIQVWVHMANISPEAFGVLIALVETALALSLITGVLSRTAMWLALPFTLIIWSVPQGFGGPYATGSTDVDSGIVYCVAFLALLAGGAWRSYSLASYFPILRDK